MICSANLWQLVKGSGARYWLQNQYKMAKNEADVQIQQERSRGVGRKARGEVRSRRSRACGDTGHSASTCQAVISSTVENLAINCDSAFALLLRYMLELMDYCDRVAHLVIKYVTNMSCE